MGKLIQCSSKIAENPYHFKLTDTNVYTIEEVCYYIRHNIYMMQQEVFEKSFAQWLNTELGMEKTSKKIENLINDHNNLKDIVVTLCCSCDYYDEAEINELISIMDEIENLSLRGRQKIKADNYMKCGLYEKAVEEYARILKSDDMINADIQEYGEIYHSMGVAFAKLDDMKRAAAAFENAYERSGSEKSLRQYIYALKLADDKDVFNRGISKLRIDEGKIKSIEKSYFEIANSVNISRQVKRIERLNETMKAGYMEEYYDKLNSYLSEWKEEYRKEISH